MFQAEVLSTLVRLRRSCHRLPVHRPGLVSHRQVDPRLCPFTVDWLLPASLFIALLCLPASVEAGLVEFGADDHAFTGPEQLESGWQTVRLVNRGRDVHQIQFLGLPPDKTVADVERALTARSPSLPNWLKRHGGVNSVAPGNQASAVINLDAGEYVLLCGIPDATGRPHAMRGMVRALRVAGAGSAIAPLPRPDATLHMKDFSFSLSEALHAGSRTLRLVNDGRQAHELVLIRLAEGASTQDFLARYRPGGLANPAGKEAGGLTGIDPGRQGYVALELEPGRYGMLCFLSDPVTGTPHFARGMWMDIEVKPPVATSEGP
jgi:hypothetical protein